VELTNVGDGSFYSTSTGSDGAYEVDGLPSGSYQILFLPRRIGGSVSGLAKGKPVVKFHLRAGSNGAHGLRSFKVRLPAGLSFVGAQLRKGVKVSGGGKVTEKLTGGQLVVTLAHRRRWSPCRSAHRR
jgi:hypothetical protein